MELPKLWRSEKIRLNPLANGFRPSRPSPYPATIEKPHIENQNGVVIYQATGASLSSSMEASMSSK